MSNARQQQELINDGLNRGFIIKSKLRSEYAIGDEISQETIDTIRVLRQGVLDTSGRLWKSFCVIEDGYTIILLSEISEDYFYSNRHSYDEPDARYSRALWIHSGDAQRIVHCDLHGSYTELLIKIGRQIAIDAGIENV